MAALLRERQKQLQLLSFSQSYRNSLVVGRLPAPGAGAVAALDHALLVDLGDDVAVAGQQRLGRAHLGAQRQLALGEPVRAVLVELSLRAVCLRAAGAVGALVHLAARAEVADLGILRRAERAGVEAIAAADAEVLGVQHHGIRRGVEAVYRADRRAGRVGAVHAGHRDRALAGLAVIDGDDAPAVDAPRYLVLVLARGDAGVAFDATIGVAEEFHTCHVRCSLCRSDLTERGLGFLHAGHRVEAVGRQGVDALAQHDRIGTLRIVAALIDALEPAGEVERAPGDALADPLGDERLHAGLRVEFGAGDPDPAAVLDAALVRVRRIDLDEHVLLQLGEPLVGPRLFAAAFVLYQTAGAEDEREVLGDALVDRRLLHVEANVRHPELHGIRQRRIFGDQLGPWRVDRLAVGRDGVGQAERVGSRLAVAVGDAAVLDGDALDAVRQVDRPGHRAW